MPFGLQGASAIFMQLINEILHKNLYKEVLVYLGEVLINTETPEEHVKLVRAVLRKLQEAQLYVKLCKCEFLKTRLGYLGYQISNKGVEMDLSKLKAILEWDTPPPPLRPGGN